MTEIDLCSSRVTSTGVTEILDALAASCNKVTCLRLSDNQSRPLGDTAIRAIRTLASKGALAEVGMSNMGLSRSDGEALVAAACASPVLKRLDISGCEEWSDSVCEKVQIALSKLARTGGLLAELNVSRNNVDKLFAVSMDDEWEEPPEGKTEDFWMPEALVMAECKPSPGEPACCVVCVAFVCVCVSYAWEAHKHTTASSCLSILQRH
jgi:hypothetical protein